MDQGPLVTEQIEAGAEFASRFAGRTPLRAAFWLKEGENGSWYFYLASDRIDDTNFDLAYAEVIRLLGPGPHLWLDPFQVKVAGLDDPFVRGVLAIQETYPGRLPTRLRNLRLGGVGVDEVYIYPVPVAAPV